MARFPTMALALALAAAGAVFGPAGASSEPNLAAAPAAPAAEQPQAEPQATKVGEEVSLATAKTAAALASADGKQVVHHPGATYVKVHFAGLELSAGDKVTVADPAGKEVYTYHGDPTRNGAKAGDSDFTRHGASGFASMSIDGDTAVVTLHKAGAQSSAAGVKIDKYWRGYTESEVRAANPGLFSVCSTDARRDVVCYRTSHPTEYTRSNAVAKLLIGGGGSCTAWRVGNTNRVLTNQHCISTQSAVASSEVQFNYQCATCGGGNPGAGTKVSGATFYKTSTGGSGALDYTLFSVNNFASIQSFGTLYLETRAATTGERIYIPGHGDGSAKRLSIFEDTQNGGLCTVRNGNYNTYNMSYSCDTSGGNSGSPVLSANHRVLALHHLGGCPSNQGAKAHLIYNEIRTLIDNGTMLTFDAPLHNHAS